MKQYPALRFVCDVSYRIVLIFSLFLLWLCCNRGRLGLVPGNLQHTTFELSSLVSCLENKTVGQLQVIAFTYFVPEKPKDFWYFNNFRWLYERGRDRLVWFSHVTYILCFASCLKGHDNTVGVLVTDILDLTIFLTLKEKTKDQYEFQCNYKLVLCMTVLYLL